MTAAAASAPAGGGGVPERSLSRSLFLVLAVLGAALAFKAAWIPMKAEAAQVLLDRAFAASLESGKPVKAWPWADAAPIARISVARLGVSEIVLSGGSGEAMAFGPTELNTHNRQVAVMTGHRDTHFTFIRDLRLGDMIGIERIDGTRATYRVAGFQTVDWNRFGIPASPARPMLALATCYPFGALTHGPLRRVAWAEGV